MTTNTGAEPAPSGRAAPPRSDGELVHGPTAATQPRRVLVADLDSATGPLIEEWLVAAGHSVVAEGAAGSGPSEPFDVAIIDLPYPRQGGFERLRRLALDHPGTPILVLSPTFFERVACFGACAAALGVAGVLPMPVARDALVSAVERVAQPR
jgi:CheY-like chemotaxis protein